MKPINKEDLTPSHKNFIQSIANILNITIEFYQGENWENNEYSFSSKVPEKSTELHFIDKNIRILIEEGVYFSYFEEAEEVEEAKEGLIGDVEVEVVPSSVVTNLKNNIQTLSIGNKEITTIN